VSLLACCAAGLVRLRRLRLHVPKLHVSIMLLARRAKRRVREY
jgi:hypothetical protein